MTGARHNLAFLVCYLPILEEGEKHVGKLQPLSGVTGEGLPAFVGRVADLVREARAAEPAPEAFVVFRPVAEGFRVERADDGGWVVVGREAERAVALSDLTNPEALAFAQHRLARLGVDRALARAGVRAGDTVHIGKLSFDYEPDEQVTR